MKQHLAIATRPDIRLRPATRSRAREGIARLVASSEYHTSSDDTLKDEDNAAWVLSLEPQVQRVWLERIRWVRLVDRLAENEVVEPEARRFTRFREDWERLLARGTMDPDGPFARDLSAIRAVWLSPGVLARPDTPEARIARLSVAAWSAYLDALSDYHAPKILLPTLRDHDDMLWRLSGRIFQLIPFLTERHWHAAGELGRIDQFFNNLRDMAEDAGRGQCYLPDDVLARFGLSRGDLISGRCLDHPGYPPMMRFWLDEHLPALLARAAPFLGATGLHPSVSLMRTWSLRRYARVTRVFCAAGFDFQRFPALYWAEVRRDLARLDPPSHRA